MSDILRQSAFFGVALTIVCFEAATVLKNRLKWPIFNPFLIATLLVIACLKLLDISYSEYCVSAQHLNVLMTPATVCLAVPLYRKLDVLRRNLAAVLGSILCGVLSALAGAHLSLGYLNGTFAENMSNSRGYSAFACVIFGAANPAKAYLAALMFGFFDAIGLRLQDYVSSDLTGIIPYAITIIMMVYVVVNAQRRRRHAAQHQLSRRARS